MMGALVLATVVLILMLRTGMELSRAEAVVLLVLYGLFMAVMVTESFDLVSLVPHLPPNDSIPTSACLATGSIWSAI
jgi:cation:H+ antiporter